MIVLLLNVFSDIGVLTTRHQMPLVVIILIKTAVLRSDGFNEYGIVVNYY